jgi:hypothetical protein
MLIDPLVPAGTTAEFDVISPALSFSVEELGCVLPVSHAVRNLIVVPTGSTAILSEYATAVAGMVQSVLVGIGIVRVSLAANAPPPNGNDPALVSTTRHGDIATNTAGVPSVAAAAFTVVSSRIRP